MTVLRMPVGKGRHSPVAADDQGRAIAALLLNPQGHIGTTIPRAGSCGRRSGILEADPKETRLTVCLVHGNPETAAVWNRLAPLLDRGRVMRLSPPGFGAPVPPGFTATVEEYRRWLIAELESVEQQVDLVGHDWGGAHVVNVAMTRPELVRSWVCDVIGLFDQDYRWHDLGQVWATPGAGEDPVAAMIDPPVADRAAALVKKGMHEDVALLVAEGHNAAMGECILSLYRDAAQPAMSRLGRNLERAAARPGLSIMASEDHLAGTDEERRRASARAGAQIEELEGLGHWWFTQDPQRGATAINRFWARVDESDVDGQRAERN